MKYAFSGAGRRSFERLLVYAVLSFVLALPAGLQAEDREAQLAHVRARLQTLQTELNTTKTRRNAVREEIAGLERKTGTLQNELRGLEHDLKREEQRLQTLQEETATQRRKLDRQYDALARQLRAQYAAGPQENVRLLLTQQDPAGAARMLTYYKYVHDARLERIEAIRPALLELHNLEQRTRTKQQEMATLYSAQRGRKTELDANRQRRGELLASLNKRVTTQSREIDQLREDEARLTRLLQEIQTAYADVPIPKHVKGAFGTLKGKLTLPTKGQIQARYGDAKSVGNLKWRGLLLGASDGTPVYAVSRGRVAYADWLRGFGLLLILEHGDGYMTLYGHNQSLQKRAGDWVEAGEMVARVGNTGDAPQSGLYFEIRHNGEPRDPLLWCRTR